MCSEPLMSDGQTYNHYLQSGDLTIQTHFIECVKLNNLFFKNNLSWNVAFKQKPELFSVRLTSTFALLIR